MNRARIATTGAVAGACALAGVLGGIAEGSAAKGHSAHKATQASGTAPLGRFGPGGRHGGGGFGGFSIHSVAVVPNQAGTGFETVTSDSGTVKSVDASSHTITITEGTTSTTYGTPTVSVPAAAKVILDGKSSSLSSLAAGDRVRVSSSSDGTATVFAFDSAFAPGRHMGWGHGGPGGPDGPMPPMPPMAPGSTTAPMMPGA